MPIYEYACGACGHRFEEWQKMSDKPIRVCPKCKSRKVEKLISQTSFSLKGGGWYSDLYAGPKPGAKDSKNKGLSDFKASFGGELLPAWRGRRNNPRLSQRLLRAAQQVRLILAERA